MRRLLVSLCVIPVMSVAQTTMPLEFPTGASAAGADVLTKRLVSQTHSVQPFSGPSWRLQFTVDGYAFIDLGNGARDKGRWRLEEGKLCIDWARFNSGCNEVRLQGETIYMKRVSNGEVVMLASR